MPRELPWWHDIAAELDAPPSRYLRDLAARTDAAMARALRCRAVAGPVPAPVACADEWGPDEEQDAIVGPLRIDHEALESWYHGQEDTPY